MEANDISSWTTMNRDLLNAYNNRKHSSTGFAPNGIKKGRHTHSKEEYKETREC